MHLKKGEGLVMKIQSESRMKRYYNYVLPVFIVFILCIFFYKNFSVLYYINDDTTMRNIASGAYTGTPDGHLIFIQYILGWFISSFYKMIPDIDWYGLFLYTFHFVCLIAILYRVLRWARDRNRLFIILITMILFCLIDIENFTTSLQFTTTAAICGVTALFLFMTIPEKCEKKELIVNYIIIAFFVLLSYCIRDKVLLMFVPFAAVVWLFRILIEKEKRKYYFVFCVVILIELSVVAGVEKVAYQSPEWKQYMEFNKARSEILDYYGYPDYDKHQQFYQENDISRAEYDLLIVGTLNFSGEITNEKYIDIAEYAKKINIEENGFLSKAKDALDNTIQYSLYIMENKDIVIIMSLYIILCIHCLYKRKYTFLITISCFLFFRELIYFYLFFKGRFLDRIYEVLILCDYFFLGGCILFTNIFKNIRLRKGIIERVVFVCIILVLVIPTCIVNKEAGQNYLVSNDTCLVEYCQTNSDKRYILDITGYSTGYEPFVLKKDVSYMNYLTIYGWSCKSALYQKKKEKMGIESIDEALLEDETYFIETASNVGNNIIDPILNYYKSNGLNIGYRVVDTISEGENIYQVLQFYNQ